MRLCSAIFAIGAALLVVSCTRDRPENIDLGHQCRAIMTAPFNNSSQYFRAICQQGMGRVEHLIVSVADARTWVVAQGADLESCDTTVTTAETMVFCSGTRDAANTEAGLWQFRLASEVSAALVAPRSSPNSVAVAADAGPTICIADPGSSSLNLFDASLGEVRTVRSPGGATGYPFLNCLVESDEVTTLTAPYDSGLTLSRGEAVWRLPHWRGRGVSSLVAGLLINIEESKGEIEIYRLGEGFELIRTVHFQELPVDFRAPEHDYATWRAPGEVGFLWFQGEDALRLKFTANSWVLSRVHLGLRVAHPISFAGDATVAGVAGRKIFVWRAPNWRQEGGGSW